MKMKFDGKLSTNRKALHDFFIEEKIEAGMVLSGWEAKSIRAGRASIAEAYVSMVRGEAVVLGMLVEPLPTITEAGVDRSRTRKLLLSRREIDRLFGKVERMGYSLIPLDIHLSRGKVKMEIGLGKGKKKYDKRDAEKVASAEKEAKQALKSDNVRKFAV